MLYPVNEIFYSIQGEGYHAGKPAVFIRLAGCNLKCTWCDTDHSKKVEMTGDDIVCEVLKFPDCPLIVITGGEPTIHPLEDLLVILELRTNSIIAIETNGTGTTQLQCLRAKGLVDWITLSPKLNCCYVETDIRVATELKVVFDGIIDPNVFEKYAGNKLERGLCYIQPCSEDYKPAVDFVLKHPQWRLSVQVQKVIGVR